MSGRVLIILIAAFTIFQFCSMIIAQPVLAAAIILADGSIYARARSKFKSTILVGV